MGEKQQWTNEHLKCLLDTCIEEVESVGASEGCFIENNSTAFSRSLCVSFFDGNRAIDNFRSYSTQSSSVAGASSFCLSPLQIHATAFHVIDDDGDDTSHHEPPPSAASPSGNPNKRDKPSTPIPPSALPYASSSDGTTITGDDLALEMKKALQSLT
ncbi:unnamed protein product [Lactuca saligna]|uniref:Uncharacterized protein n=1 Tax=Lactuca saligna TaxID=75948 RepID=A0AA36EBX0_LACSI|nr:unnamed protein product [Lactuca saligna]